MLRRYTEKQALYVLLHIPMTVIVGYANAQYMKDRMIDWYTDLTKSMIGCFIDV